MSPNWGWVGDIGALFDFDLGLVDVGQTRSFYLYYGAAADEASAMSALTAVGAQVYSLGEPSTTNGPTLGQPNTFIFGYRDPQSSSFAAPGAQQQSESTTDRSFRVSNDVNPNGHIRPNTP